MAVKRRSIRSRSKWVPALARAIGWAPQRLRNLFAKHDIHAPFKSELEGLRVLKEEGIDFSDYQPTEDAVGVDLGTLESAPEPNGNGAVRVETQTGKPGKKPSHWSRKIIPRLARLLPEGDTKEGKIRVRWILRKGGYTGKPGHVDEATALDIFQKEGISIEKFEYAGTGGASPSITALTPEEIATRYGAALEQVAELESINRGLMKKIKLVREMLVQYEKQLSLEFNAGRLPGLGVVPLHFPLDALAIIRYDHQLLH